MGSIQTRILLCSCLSAAYSNQLFNRSDSDARNEEFFHRLSSFNGRTRHLPNFYRLPVTVLYFIETIHFPFHLPTLFPSFSWIIISSLENLIKLTASTSVKYRKQRRKEILRASSRVVNTCSAFDDFSTILQECEVFPVTKSSDKSMKNHREQSLHATGFSPIYFFFRFHSRIVVYHVQPTERRSSASLIIPLNGKPISRFVPRRLANTGPPMAGTKGRNWKTTSAYITKSGYACIRRLDAVLRRLRDSSTHDLLSLWIISWTTRSLLRVG